MPDPAQAPCNIIGTGTGGNYVPGVVASNGPQNTYSGGTYIMSGAVAIPYCISVGSATPNIFGGSLTSGPFGTGALYLDGGQMRTTNATQPGGSVSWINGGVNWAIGNAVQIMAPTTFAAGGTNPLVFTGPTTLIGSQTITQLGTPVVFAGSIGDNGNNYTVTMGSTSTGTLELLAPNSYGGGTQVLGGTLLSGGPTSLGSGTVALAAGATLDLFGDGDGTGLATSLTYTNALTLTGTSATLGVNRSGVGAVYGSNQYLQAANKTVNLGSSFSLNNFTLTVANGNGYGLNFTGSQTLAGPTTISVGTNTSTYTPGTNAPQPGLTVSGQVTGTGSITKTGAGMLYLSNPANNFSSAITVNQGGIAYTADSDLGTNPTVTLAQPGNGNESTLVALGSFASNVDLKLGLAASGSGTLSLRVPAGQTLALNNAFDLSLSTTSSLTRDDSPGNLVLLGNNANWTGTLQINGGILQVNGANYANSLGTASAVPTVIAYQGAAFQALPGQTIVKPFTLGVNGLVSGINSGINSGGAIEAVANGLVVPGMTTWSSTGASTLFGAITLTNSAAWIGADPGTVLNLTGGISGAQALTLASGGTINIANNPLGAVSSLIIYTPGAAAAAGLPAGVTTLTASSGGFVNGVTVEAGSLVISGTGQLGSTSGTAAVVDPGATLSVLDNSATPIANRLGGRPLTINGGTFSYTANGTSASSETVGALSAGGCGDTLNLTNTGAAPSMFKVSSVTVGSSGNLNIVTTGAALGTTANTFSSTTSPTLVPASTGIISRATVNGTSFATYNAATGVVPFNAYSAAGSNVDLAAATDTMNLTTSPTWAQSYNRTLNAVVLGNGVTINGPAASQSLTLTTGNVLVPSGNATIGSGVVIADAGTETAFLVNAGASLNVQGPVTGTYNFTKGLGGTLILSAPVYDTTTTNWFAINGGSLQLNAGNQTLQPGFLMTLTAGATLDLNGNAQMVNQLMGGAATTFVGNGGTITSSSGTGTLVDNTAGSTTFPGQIVGNVNFGKAGTSNLALTGSNNYGGPTSIVGGTVTLQDAGMLAGTSAINVNNATLAVTDNGLTGISNRLGTAPIALGGGVLTYTGRTQTASVQSAGAVTLASGESTFTVTNGGTGVNSAELDLAGLVQTNDATVNFGAVSGQAGGSNATRLLIAGAANNSNNILGVWAVAGNNWASYNSTLGVAALSAVGFPGYNASTIAAGSNPSYNILLAAAGTLTAGGATFNTLNTAGNSVSFVNNGDVLNLAGGGLLSTGGNSIGSVASAGVLTAGGTATSGMTDLYIYGNAGTTTIYSPIEDTATALNNGSTANVRLVLNPMGGTITLSNQTAANTYTGGTVVNGGIAAAGTVNLSAASAGTGARSRRRTDDQQRHRDDEYQCRADRSQQCRHPQRRLDPDPRGQQQPGRRRLQQQRRHGHPHPDHQRHAHPAGRRVDRLVQQPGHHGHRGRNRQLQQYGRHDHRQSDPGQRTIGGPLAGHAQHYRRHRQRQRSDRGRRRQPGTRRPEHVHRRDHGQHLRRTNGPHHQCQQHALHGWQYGHERPGRHRHADPRQQRRLDCQHCGDSGQQRQLAGQFERIRRHGGQYAHSQRQPHLASGWHARSTWPPRRRWSPWEASSATTAPA